MSSELEARSDHERALRWLRHRLEWEAVLTELRAAGAATDADRERAEQEPAAA